jgi:hypothetical protein
VIGRFVAGPPAVRMLDAAGQVLPIAGTGWRHF